MDNKFSSTDISDFRLPLNMSVQSRHMLRLLVSVLVVSVDTESNPVAAENSAFESRGWGLWTEWSVCLKACEPELSSRSRSCLTTDIPCAGFGKEYRLCDTKLCAGKVVDVRRTECERQVNVPFRGRRYHWSLYIIPENECEVACQAVQFGFVARLERHLPDGVACNTEDQATTKVCLHARCQVVGCDGVVGSGLRNDHCGVCGGDNESCRVIAGIFTRSNLEHGYNQITRIPKGACHINVTELEYSRNYLVLKYPNGTGILNNDRTMMKAPGQYGAAGTLFSYGKRAGPGCPGECLYGQGPITEDLDVQLLTYSRNPGIKYFFTIPKDLLEDIMKGISRSSVRRHDSQHATPTQGPDDTYTQGRRQISYDRQPQYVAAVDKDAQQKDYQALEGGGTQNLQDTQNAINRYRQGYDQNEVRNGRVIPNTISTDPSPYHDNSLLGAGNSYQGRQQGTQRQYGQVASRYGLVAPPSENSIPQGTFDDLDLNGQYSGVGAGYNGRTIAAEKPKLMVPNTIDEVNFQWTISGFTECTTSCGGGTQETVFVCVKRNSNVIVTDENCNPAKKVVQTVPCNKSPCPPDWEADAWSVCSRTCGSGIQTRKVECRQRYSHNISSPITASLCDMRRRPQHSQTCQVKPCADWVPGNWSKCSVECGIGQRSRPLECVNSEGGNVSNTECLTVRPETSETCDMGTCAQGWFHTEWSKQCSTPCGQGHKTRSVYCLAEDGTQLPESKCGKKPKTRKACKKTRPCGGTWFEGPWSQCSATCGMAVQTRDVVCMKKVDKDLFAIVDKENCKRSKRPEMSRACASQPPCPSQWHTTQWTQCSQSCGTGTKTRDVKCLDAEGTPNAQCEAEVKPKLRTTCNTQDCNLPQLDEDPNCKDTGKQDCARVVPARLCQYAYFYTDCCHSCTLHNLQHGESKQQLGVY
ncbi:uncharacterized protein LOC127880047 isoform X1 [Dreissena polymorpha]|uniref:uncharacterized protein LOC127880047 isoform X1 n=1 Tax=Dreissena polymorpha TaxID=45954 RepID=UPI002264BF15|nr:uncharacterized protein LOC127880047 isoform X1 [Dreissena polymorpha]